MSALTDKVKKLILLALAPNTPVEEARSSSMLALRLLVKHNLIVGANDIETIVASYESQRSIEVPSKPQDTVPPPSQSTVPPQDTSLPPVPTSRAELRELAKVKVHRFVEHLRSRYQSGGHLRMYLADYVVGQTLKHFDKNSVSLEVLRTLHYYVQSELRERVKNGELRSKSGSKGGYQLRVEEKGAA